MGRTGLQKRGKYKLKQLAVSIKGWRKKGVGRPVLWGDISIFYYASLLQFDFFSYIHQTK